MKNIHVLPTEKPSRLMIDTIENKLYFQPILHEKTINVLPQHIYITSDEEINARDWAIQVNFEKTNTQLVHYLTDAQVRIANDKDGSFTKNKIILTTDQDLIADGVQAIDDEFLEWFVKNPSCNNVEVKTVRTKYFGNISYIYKIIIPEEEPKQETLEEAEKEFEKLINGKALPTKQLTEVAEHYFIVGYEIGQEKMYSEEEVKRILMKTGNYTKISLDVWFEQFKKK